jgi:AraC-like DNA-binding protein
MMSDDTSPLPPSAADETEPGTSDLALLARLLRAHTPYDGRFELRIPGVYAIRVSRTSAELLHYTHAPALCIVAQGAKRVLLGQEVFEYDTSRLFVVSVDVPVASHIIHASRSAPFLAFRLDLDPARVAELVLKVYPNGVPPAQPKRGVLVGPSSAGVVNAATRLVELMAHPGDAELLAPLVIDEILIRLLRSQMGGRVAQIGRLASNMHKIAKAVAWLRANYTQSINIEELAKLVHMSPSSFHQHFSAVTSMSPLQYQKSLRLQEARRLMVSAMLDVGAAGRQVGYASTSQFTREYGRYFGSSPTKDIAWLRAQDLPAADVAQELVGDAAEYLMAPRG